MPASFESGNDVPANLPNNNINKGRWTMEEHKIFMQEYDAKQKRDHQIWMTEREILQ
jgi:hypothetical protein